MKRGLFAVLFPWLLLGCGKGVDASVDAGLRWFTTCGDPSCSLSDAGPGDGGVPGCGPGQQAGSACTTEGASCDPGAGCHQDLLCAPTDPRMGPGGCPISRERFKKDIRYLSAEELGSLHDQLLSLPLATWRYRDAPAGTRLQLGFMIDGHESMLCVQPERDQVDLYAYASMAVAALKVQDQEIKMLRKEVEALRAGLERKSESAARRRAP